MFELQVGPDGVVKFMGRLDASAAEEVRPRLSALSGPLTADFSALEYVSSAGQIGRAHV